MTKKNPVVGRARSGVEMEFAASLVPCEGCGTRELGKLDLYGDHDLWSYATRCPRCGKQRLFTYPTTAAPYELVPPSFELGLGPSTLISEAQFRDELARVRPLIVADPTELDVAPWHASRDALHRALVCITELAKLVTDPALAAEKTELRELLPVYARDGDRIFDIQHAELTPAETEAALEHRVPDSDFVWRLLVVFFSSFSKPMVTRLETELRTLLADPEKRSVIGDAFVGNGPRYIGQAWKELLSNHRQRPTPSELAIWLAVTGENYPRPRPYCPVPLLGRWRQVAPVPATWRFHIDGSVQTDDPHYAKRNRWCVHRRRPEAPDLVAAEILFTGELAFVPIRLVLREVTPERIRGSALGPDDAIDYVLER